MNRNAKMHVDMIESLESRTLLSVATPKVVGYLPEYRYDLASKIDLAAVNHVNYFAIHADTDGDLVKTDIVEAHLKATAQAVHAFPGHTISICVDWNTPFVDLGSNLDGNDTALDNFITQIKKLATDNNLDGVDLDWEPSGPSASDVNAYGHFINRLHDQAPSLLLSAAVNPITKVVPKDAIGALNWINVMDYDIQLGDHSDYNLAVQYLDGWNTYGVPKNKLVMGLPFYGQDGQGYGGTHVELYSTIVDHTHPGLTTNVVNDPIAGKTWHFDSIQTVQKKAHHVLDNGFGGIMIWELGQDHFDNAGHYDQYSLLPAIKSVITSPAWLQASDGAVYSYDGANLNVQLGTVTFNADASTTNPNLNVTVSAGASVVFSANQHLGALTVAGNASFGPGFNSGAFALVNGAFSVTAAGKFNLGANDLIVKSGNLAAINAAIASARTAANTWSGNGITSSFAANLASHRTGLAAATAGSIGLATADGQSLLAADVLVRYTVNGDANLDRTVGFPDLVAVAQHYGASGANWATGDFDNDGSVAFADMVTVAQNYGVNVASLMPAAPVPTAAAAQLVVTPKTAAKPAALTVTTKPAPVARPLTTPFATKLIKPQPAAVFA